MQCPRCHGSRRIATVPIERIDGFMLHYEVIDCPYCEGTGIVDCCDGDVAQPGPSKDLSVKLEKPIPLEDGSPEYHIHYVARGPREAIENFKRLAGFESDE